MIFWRSQVTHLRHLYGHFELNRRSATARRSSINSSTCSNDCRHYANLAGYSLLFAHFKSHIKLNALRAAKLTWHWPV